MNVDALDDIARQAAAATNRRATLKAVAAAVIVTPFLGGIPRRRPSRRRPTLADAGLADESPQCDWAGAAYDCAQGELAAAACGATVCAPGINVIGAAKCAACLAAAKALLEKCKKELNCHCLTGEYCSSGWGFEGTCCQPPDECVNPYGCQPPCGPCEERRWSGDCVIKCTSSQTCCGGACTDTSRDNANCGGCGNACTNGGACQGGQCICPSGYTICSDQCVNTETDTNNCGACGNACASGETCQSGQCSGCPTGETLCYGACYDLQNGVPYCGSCGHICPNNTVCKGGTCGCPSNSGLTLCYGIFCCSYGCCEGGCLGSEGNKCCHSPKGDYECGPSQTCCSPAAGSYTCCG
jgi:stigma-specific protein Stig1